MLLYESMHFLNYPNDNYYPFLVLIVRLDIVSIINTFYLKKTQNIKLAKKEEDTTNDMVTFYDIATIYVCTNCTFYI